MDPNPFSQYLPMGVIARLTMLPLALQILRANFNFSGRVAAVVNLLVVIVLVVWGAFNPDMATSPAWWGTVAGFCVLGWFYTEMIYRKVIEPMAKNESQPLVPASESQRAAAIEENGVASGRGGRKAPMLAAIFSALLLLVIVTPARAQKLTDVGARASIAVNGSYLWFSESGGNPNWTGFGLGGSAGYSLHELFSVFGAYDHGFPVGEGDPHVNFLRAMGSLRIYPPRGEQSDNRLFLSAGRAWWGEDTVKDRVTNEVGIQFARKIKPRAGLFLNYTRSFAVRESEADFDHAKAGVIINVVKPGN